MKQFRDFNFHLLIPLELLRENEESFFQGVFNSDIEQFDFTSEKQLRKARCNKMIIDDYLNGLKLNDEDFQRIHFLIFYWTDEKKTISSF